MDLQPPTNQAPSFPNPAKQEKPAIRTMRGDLERLSKVKTPQAPEKLPVPPVHPSSEPQPSQPAPPLPPRPLPPKKIPEKSKGPTPKKSKRGLKWFIGLIIVLFVGAGGFLYWWNYIRFLPPLASLTHFECQNSQCIEVEGEGENQCLANADCLPEEPEEPNSLIPVSETKTIEISISQPENQTPESLLLEKIKTAVLQEQGPGLLKRILVKIINGEKKYASLGELISGLGINIPQNILTDLKDYTLFFYTQNEGPRLGLIIETAGDIKENLTLWETAMTADLEPLFLEAVKEEPENRTFQDNVYQNIAIRYLNLPDPSLTIDYASIGNKLIITTSKETIYQALEVLLK